MLASFFLSHIPKFFMFTRMYQYFLIFQRLTGMMDETSDYKNAEYLNCELV